MRIEDVRTMDTTRLNNYLQSPMNPLNVRFSTPFKHIANEIWLFAEMVWARWGWTKRAHALRLAHEIVTGEPRKEMVHRFMQWRVEEARRNRQ